MEWDGVGWSGIEWERVGRSGIESGMKWYWEWKIVGLGVKKSGVGSGKLWDWEWKRVGVGWSGMEWDRVG
jgi:hypothetical protein